ncbi:hypothetical protein BN13_1030008 [Nostocoides jenkinsii Ben 74]|uniref:Uncharacterized protein n=1 Tax=Nostocoides jenkinsii Ben 74 TaxID=1193518 RepID=A0A077M9J6_9MICO|nr:hypothetical protein BN13_1030008 [Tetrasphaera jenkinsii Ben 74]
MTNAPAQQAPSVHVIRSTKLTGRYPSLANGMPDSARLVARDLGREHAAYAWITRLAPCPKS